VRSDTRHVTGQPLFGREHTPRGVVQSSCICGAPGLYVWQRGAQLRLWPALQTLDFALARAFRISERSNFQFGPKPQRSEQGKSGHADRFVNTPQFGTITMAMTPGREIQLSARVFVLRFRKLPVTA